MFDLPMHPILVHFPMALAALLPLAALAALIAGFRSGPGAGSRQYWAIIVVLQAFLAGSSFLAMQAGEKDEERVEKVLASEAPLETHEENGELFMKATAIGLVVSALGLASGPLGFWGRIAGGGASLIILLLGIQVGHSGGQLVYKHGAAAAFTATGATSGTGAGNPPGDTAPGRTGAGQDDD